MAKKSSTAAGTDASYKRFLKNVELYALGLDSVSADLRRYEYGEATSPTHTIKSTFELVEFDADHFDLIAKMTLVVGDEAESPLLNISVAYSGHFHPETGEFERKDVERFTELEARLIFWPYFRQTVSDLTSRMHIRPLTIPLTL